MTANSFYSRQSEARKITSSDDVQRLSRESEVVFDRIIGPFLPSEKSACIYEAATGPGILQFWLCKQGFTNREGSDFSEKEAYLAQHVTPAIRHADSLSDLTERFTEKSLQTIIALDFYEHIERENFIRFLKIAHSRLSPEGWLVLRGPNADSPLVSLNLYNDVTHIWAYTTTCLRVLCRLEGFQDVRFCDDAIPGLHHGAAWKTPLMRLAQNILTQLVWMASRQRVQFWGSSIYLFARKG
jgi:2-polyprenyl-3-methyl-5-hydroxy-6-metoxy-1,4-benzoquinol methylase